MYFEINVNRNGVHYFATHERSITTTFRLGDVLRVFREKFPAAEGFEVTATFRRSPFVSIDIDKFLEDLESYEIPSDD